MTDGDWVALSGILVTIIINIISSISDNRKTRVSNTLTRKSIRLTLKQERSEESMKAIIQFNTEIWPMFIDWINLMNRNSLERIQRLQFSRIYGLYKSWIMYLKTDVANSRIIRDGLQNRMDAINLIHDIINSKTRK